MNRRNFFKLTGTCTGGLLLLPDFLYSFAMQENLSKDDSCLVFIQLMGGNDGLNTFIPYTDDLYYHLRPNVAIPKNEVINSKNGMGWHPALPGFAKMQQDNNLSVIQNVGYPGETHSHFRSQEIWQTGSNPTEYLTTGWLGRFLDHQHEHSALGGINFGNIDTLALRGVQPNSLSLKNPKAFKNTQGTINTTLSNNPQLDFVRKVANSITEGSAELEKALSKSGPSIVTYPGGPLSKNLEWMARLIKGDLNSKVYFTTLNGFDTHSSQTSKHLNLFKTLDDAVFSFYTDLKQAQVLEKVTIVIYSEFGRRVVSAANGTDHGTAAPMFIIGGKNKGAIIGKNPDLLNLNNGDLIYETDFRSVYASLLKNKFNFKPDQIGIKNAALQGLF
jgi:uncharacterized protein (DUF1501 family)